MIKKLSAIIGFSLLSSVASALPTEAPSVMNHTELLRVITGLIVVLLIIGVLSWLVKRLQGVHMGNSGGFQSLASMTLGPKERIVLVRTGEHYLLLGVGSGSVNLLYDFGQQLPEGFDPENKASFAQILKSAVRKS